MKACPFCAEEIQDAAVVCKHCRRDLNRDAAVPSTSAPPAKKKTSLATKAVVVIGSLMFIGWCSSLVTPTPSAVPTSAVPGAGAVDAPPTTPPAPDPEPLVLVSSKGYENDSGSYWYVEGQIKNISTSPIKSLVAVSTWYGKDGGFIKSDSAMVDFDPLLPGQTAPFKTISSGNPAMSTYTVQFRTSRGATINARDDRKK